jgi:hypothetical protein
MEGEINDMTLWRLNIKTAAQKGFDPCEFCLSKNLAGVGWPVVDGRGKPPRNLEEYKDLGHVKYSLRGDRSWWPALNVLGFRMKDGDLCWTRDASGTYFLGRIIGPWSYLHGKEATAHDIHSVRPCDWQKVGLLDAVPGAVERSFGPARTVQVVRDEAAAAFSSFLFARLRGEPTAPLSKKTDIFGLLSPLDHEDLAALYLQTEHHFVIVPSTVKRSTAAYEWLMFSRTTGQEAALQVKSGAAKVDLAKLGKIGCPVYVVAADSVIDHAAPANVIWIKREMLLAFAKRNRNILPKRIRFYMEWAGL